MTEGELLADVFKEEDRKNKLIEELTEALLDVVNYTWHSFVDENKIVHLDSMCSSTGEDAIRLLAKLDVVELIEYEGRGVTAKIKRKQTNER